MKGLLRGLLPAIAIPLVKAKVTHQALPKPPVRFDVRGVHVAPSGLQVFFLAYPGLHPGLLPVALPGLKSCKPFRFTSYRAQIPKARSEGTGLDTRRDRGRYCFKARGSERRRRGIQ